MGSLNIVDAIIILGFLAGAVIGFKRGFIQSGVAIVGLIVVIILAFIFKNPIAIVFYNTLPFFKFNGLVILNILIYEALAFIIAFLIFGIVLKLLIKLSGLIETVLKFTVILSIPSKILGLLLGLVEAFIFIFIGLFIFSQFKVTNELITESRYAPKIITKSPFISKKVGNAYDSFVEVYALADEYKNVVDKNEYNKKSLDILLKNNVITIKNIDNLIEKNKLNINGSQEIINKYR